MIILISYYLSNASWVLQLQPETTAMLRGQVEGIQMVWPGSAPSMYVHALTILDQLHDQRIEVCHTLRDIYEPELWWCGVVCILYQVYVHLHSFRILFSSGKESVDQSVWRLLDLVILDQNLDLVITANAWYSVLGSESWRCWLGSIPQRESGGSC